MPSVPVFLPLAAHLPDRLAVVESAILLAMKREASRPHDRLNRIAWRDRRTVDAFLERSGFFCRGEMHAMGRLAAEAAGEPLLDIGIGGGRTTEFLLPLTEDYVGIDYLPELVTVARRRFPEVRFEQMDARDLSRFSPESFGAVVFSLNGIDGMSHADRLRALAEIRRVLRPGGWFAYSTHNLAYAMAPRQQGLTSSRAFGHPILAPGALRREIRGWWGRRRQRDQIESGDGWASIAGRAYGHPVIWHHTTCAAAIREVCTAGLDGHIEIFTSQGEAVLAEHVGDSLSALACPSSADLHVLAQRPEGP